MIKLNENIVEMGRFPDGTMAIKNEFFADIVNENEFAFEWYYENNNETMLLFNVVMHLKEHAPRDAKFYLYMYYIPNARMDRTKEVSEVFTLKYFCQLINMMNFEKVFVLDAHSSVSLALIDRVVQLDVGQYINNAIEMYNPDVIFFPDEGSCKRYADIINGKAMHGRSTKTKHAYPVAYANKKRDWCTAKILGLEVVGKELLEGKRVLIVDDICSKGGTFYYSAKALRECGATNIGLYITHCENTILTGDLIKSDLVENIYTTNSIFTEEHPLITKVNL